MKKAFSFITLIFFTLIYLVSSSEEYILKISKFKFNSNSIFSSDKYKYGDLFGMSYLSKFKVLKGSDYLDVKTVRFKNSNNINLCLVHDSYLSNEYLKSKNQFIGIDTIYNIEYPWWRNKQCAPIQLDTTKKNFLVFEITERSLGMLDNKNAFNLVKIENENIKQIIRPKASILNKTYQYLFNKNINTNLEFILFDNRIFTPLKELKSYINLSIFNKINSDVFISKKSEYLFFSPTKTSIQNKLESTDVLKIVKLLNSMFNYYKSKGFDEIYFSIIPNPISVIKPDCENYNNLIPLIQSSKKLKMRIIDIYSVFIKTKIEIYYHSDTHWNKNGFQLWMNEFNKTICARSIKIDQI